MDKAALGRPVPSRTEGPTRDIAELLTRAIGRPSHKPVVWYKDFLYQAASWKMARPAWRDATAFRRTRCVPHGGTSVIANNPRNLWRLVLPKRIDHRSLTSLQQGPVKTGRRLIKHARYYWLLLAESDLTRRLFGGMLRRIAALPSPAR